MIVGNDRSHDTKFQAGPRHSQPGVKVIKHFPCHCLSMKMPKQLECLSQAIFSNLGWYFWVRLENAGVEHFSCPPLHKYWTRIRFTWDKHYSLFGGLVSDKEKEIIILLQRTSWKSGKWSEKNWWEGYKTFTLQ